MVSFFGKGKYKLENLTEISGLLNRSFEKKEDVVEALKEIRNVGGGIDDILQTSNLGRSINNFSNNSRYKSIDEAIVDFQKSSLKKDKIPEIEKQKAEEGEIVKKPSRTDRSDEKKREKQEKKEKIEKEKEEVKKKEKDENANEVEEQIREVSKKAVENLKGNENLQKTVKDELEAVMKGKAIKTDDEEVSDLADKMAQAMGREKDVEITVEAKKIQISRKEYENKNIEKVRDYQKTNFEKEFVEETVKLNPNLSEEQKILVKKKANVIADVYFGNNGIEDQKNFALEFNKDAPRGVRDTAWTDMQGITSLLKKTPKELEKIKGEYQSIKSKLEGINLPNMGKLKSFEGIMESLQDPITNKLFGRAQRYVQMFDKIDSLTGGWLKRTAVEWGGKFATKIGNQAVSTFVQNSMSVLAEKGFEQGFSTILKGIFSGGVKATGTAAVKAGAGAAAKAGGKAVASFGAKLLAKLGIEAGVATVPVAGWVVALALVALDIVIGAIKIAKKIGDKIAEKLNIKIGVKDWFQDNFGKFFGGIFNFIAKIVGTATIGVGAATAPIAIPIIIGVVVILVIFGGQNNVLVSSSVPPTEQDAGIEVEGSDPGTDSVEIGPTKCSVADKVVLTAQSGNPYGSVKMRADGRCDATLSTSGCGPVSASEILQGWNKTLTPEFLMSDPGSPYYNVYDCAARSGTRLETAEKAFRQYMGEGTVTRCAATNTKYIAGLICNNQAVMIHLRWTCGYDEEGNPKKCGHYVVGVAVDMNDEIIIKDPASGGKVRKFPSNYSGKSILRCTAVKVN